VHQQIAATGTQRTIAWRSNKASSFRALVGGCLEIETIRVALSEVKRDLVKRALFPLFRFGQPENPMLGIQ
jgi:hypothetical protein